MKYVILTVLLATPVVAQPVASEADCSAGASLDSGAVQYCEVRESPVWWDGESLRVENPVSGSITVLPWDEPGVQLRAEVAASAGTWGEAFSLAMQVEVDTSNGAVAVKGPRMEGRRWWTARLFLRVPRTAALTLQTVNGSIVVEDIDANVSATNVNGSVTISRVSGDVTVRGVNGSVRVAVDRWRGQSIDVASTNGGIELDLPQDTAARADLSLTVGTISVAIGKTTWTTAGFAKQESFDIGGGGSPVRAALTAGSIRLRVR